MKTSSLNYAFSVGKIRALEKYLIKKEVFEEAIRTSLDETLRLFVESNLYGEELLGVNSSGALEELLNKEKETIKKLISGLIIDKKILSVLDLDNLGAARAIFESYRSPLLCDYIRHLADMHNIKTFLRLYTLKEPIDLLKSKLAGGGFVGAEIFVNSYSQDLSFFLNRLEHVHKRYEVINYSSFFSEGIRRVEKENSFVTLEKAVNDFLIEILLPAKYLSFGFEPVVAYYFAKLNEINLIRMIILSKLNDLPDTIMKERLNNVYA